MGYAPVYFTENSGKQIEKDQIVFERGVVFARGATDIGQMIVSGPSWTKEGKLTQADGEQFVRSLQFAYRGTRLRVGKYVEQSAKVKAWSGRVRERAEFVMAINGHYRVKAFDKQGGPNATSFSQICKAFDPSEPRDAEGKWTDGGGSVDELKQITDIPETRDAQVDLLNHLGNSIRPEYLKEFRDDLVRSAVEGRVKEHNEMVRLTSLTPVDAIAPQLTMLQRELSDATMIAERAQMSAKPYERRVQVKIDALLARQKQLGSVGTMAAKIDRSTLSYSPAKTIKEAEDFWTDKGVRAKFDIPRDAVKDEDGLDDKKNRWILEDVNAVNGALVDMVKKYPSFDLKAVGMMYALDKDNWDQSFAYNMEKERIAFEKSGKSRFVKTAAEKRVRKLMISEPAKGDEAEAKNQYDIFTTANASDRMRQIAFNHRGKFLMDTVEEGRSNREKARNGGRPLGNVATDARSVATHEAAHILDFSYGISEHPLMKDLFSSLDNPEGKERIEREISVYAASATKHDESQGNIKEFIAEGFLESTYSDPSPLGRQVGDVIEKIVHEVDGKKAVSV